MIIHYQYTVDLQARKISQVFNYLTLATSCSCKVLFLFYLYYISTYFYCISISNSFTKQVTLSPSKRVLNKCVVPLRPETTFSPYKLENQLGVLNNNSTKAGSRNYFIDKSILETENE